MKTKIFCDTADYKIIKKFTESFLVQGFTTNPSLMRLAGAKNYENYAKKILRICSNKPISFEVFADDSNEMIKQGLKIKEWGKNVYVKIPVTNSKGKFSGKAIKYLSHRNVKLNITAVYTVHQTIKIIRNLNKNTKSIWILWKRYIRSNFTIIWDNFIFILYHYFFYRHINNKI